MLVREISKNVDLAEDPQNRRAVVLTLTDGGREVTMGLNRFNDDFYGAILARMGRGSLEEFFEGFGDFVRGFRDVLRDKGEPVNHLRRAGDTMNNERDIRAESPEERFIRRSGEAFDSEFYCAESVLMAGAEYLGVRSDVIPRIATGLCSGLARTCGPCGAVTGAVLVIGLAAGREDPDEGVEATYIPVQAFLDRFREDFGSINCLDLTGIDIGTEEGRNAFQEQQLRTRCREFVTRAASLLTDLLAPKDPIRSGAG